MVDTVTVIVRMLAGGFFIWAASSKFGRTRQFWADIMGYDIVGPRIARLLAAILPPLEFFAGLFFAAGVVPLSSASVLTVLLVIFTGAVAYALLRKLNNDCGCTGSTKVSPRLIARNALLLGGVIVGTFAPAPAYPGEAIIALLAVVLVGAATSVSYRALAR